VHAYVGILVIWTNLRFFFCSFCVSFANMAASHAKNHKNPAIAKAVPAVSNPIKTEIADIVNGKMAETQKRRVVSATGQRIFSAKSAMTKIPSIIIADTCKIMSPLITLITRLKKKRDESFKPC
jgi:hypothetical protein